jgi:hypothetical protein
MSQQRLAQPINLKSQNHFAQRFRAKTDVLFRPNKVKWGEAHQYARQPLASNQSPNQSLLKNRSK